MRFLHTGDWHIGKTLRARSRTDEFAAALDEVARIAIDARVDAVLVAGDVFDSPAPPPEAERLVYDFLARLLPERIACVIIAGNHDHPRKLGALARLLEGLRIHVRPEVRPPAQGGVVELASRDGREQARVAVLPFVPERKVVDACQILEPEYSWYEQYGARIEQMLSRLTAGFTPDTVNLVLAHVLVDGARVGTGERPLHLGEIYGVNAQQLPANAQYIGLGHLHRPQELMAPSRAFYSGSLIELDFGEREQEKCVVLVEAAPGRAARVEWAPLHAGRRLREVAGTLAELQALAGTTGTDYLRVRVRAQGPLPGIADQVREILPNALDVSVDYERQEAAPERARLQQLRPAELFTDFFARKNGAAPPPDLMALFESVYEEATQS
ncbi:MAG TPA: exonuclease SbcCD subunit D [Vicinamibacteria bacterium]|nr:exonuclease SbcCD subunit D [Vicinamibacteria bacterium]